MTENQEKELFSTLGKLVTSVNVIQSDVKDIKVTLVEHTRTLDEHSSRFDRLEGSVQVASGRQDDVIPKVIELQKTVNRISETQSEQTFKIIELLNRLNRIEIQLRAQADETTSIKLEIKDVRKAVHSLIDPIQIGWDLRENLRDIEQRITSIEQKLDN